MSTAKEIVNLEDAQQQRWTELLRQIAAGVPLEAACLSAKITSTEITVATLNPAEAQRWSEARLVAKRRRWPQLQVDEILDRFAAGLELEAALVAVRGSDADVGELYELMDAPDLAARYAAAQRARALRSAESLLAIADDSSKDVLSGPKGDIPNMAAVNRSRLQLETRQWLNGAWHPDRFGERKNNVQVNVQVNNHAEQLEAAQTRARLRGAKPKISQHVIDAAFSPAEENRKALESGAAFATRVHTETTESEPVTEQPAAEVKDFWGLND